MSRCFPFLFVALIGMTAGLTAQPNPPLAMPASVPKAFHGVLDERAFFSEGDFQPLRGNRDLMLATWFARLDQNAADQGTAASSGGTGITSAIAVSRVLAWYPDQSLLASRIIRFGPAPGRSSLSHVPFGWLPGTREPLTEQTARNGPARQTWSARVHIPYRTTPNAGDSLSAEGLVRQLCWAAGDQRRWVLEQADENGPWRRVQSLQPESAVVHVHSTEDWSFDPTSFCLYARVIGLDWQDDGGVRYRIRVSE